MRAIRHLLLLLMVVVIAVLAYNAWTGNGWTLRPTTSPTGIDADRARERSAAFARKAADTTRVAAARTETALNEAAISAKIKSKMALDDHVKARDIRVETSAGIVTLTGTVHSEAERQRAVRLARDTEGVSRVVDRLQVAP